MLQRLKALTRQTFIYGFGHILARAVTFLLMPLYTNVFTVEEYGVISLAYIFMGFTIVALHYGLDAALMKWYVPAGQADRHRFFSTAYVSFLITTAVFTLILLVLRRSLAGPLLGGDYPQLMALVAVILMFDVLWAIPLLLLRSEGRPGAFVGFSLLNVGASLTLNLLLVLKFDMGITGVLLANVITSGAIFLISLPLVVHRFRWRAVSWPTWRSLMRFGLPFLPSGIFAMIMEMADRYLLRILTDMDTVGIYSAGHKLGMLMLLVVMGFNAGWHPFFLRQGDSPESRRLFARVATLVVAVLGFVWVVMLLWVPRLLQVRVGSITLYGPEFWGSLNIVPLIALGYFFHATYLLQLPGVFLMEKTRWVAITRGVGATTNIVLNLILIPVYGAVGAAIGTALAYLTEAVLFWLVNRRIFPLPLEWGRLARTVLFMLAIFVLAQNVPLSMGRDVLLTVLFPVGLLLTGFLTAGERDYLLGAVRRIIAR